MLLVGAGGLRPVEDAYRRCRGEEMAVDVGVLDEVGDDGGEVGQVYCCLREEGCDGETKEAGAGAKLENVERGIDGEEGREEGGKAAGEEVGAEPGFVAEVVAGEGGFEEGYVDGRGGWQGTGDEECAGQVGLGWKMVRLGEEIVRRFFDPL